MKPVSFKAMPSSYFMNGDYYQNFGRNNTVADIKGNVKKLGENYQNATVVLYGKHDLLPIAIRRPDENGHYEFLGLNNSLNCFVVAFDKAKQFNAVIQDNVVPK